MTYRAGGRRAEEGEDDARAIASWLLENAIPVRGVEAGSGFADLRPLKQTLEGARVVGLGEATHGTREFFLFKHRLLEFLVEEMGFTVFGIESDHAACLGINRYVLHGEGDPEEALAGQGYWTWNTEEVLAMIRWMRRRNRSVPEERKVKFLGFDAHDPDRTAEALSSYLRRAAPEKAEACEAARQALAAYRLPKVRAALARLISPLRVALGKAPFERDPAGARQAKAHADGLVSFLGANEEALVRRTSAAEFEEASRHALALVQIADVRSRSELGHGRPEETASAARDLHMARNVERILGAEPTGTRMVVWAHNGHVSKGTMPGGVPAMGRHLREAFGDGYYSVGFSFGGGSFQALRLGLKGSTPAEYAVGPAAEGSVEWYLAQPGLGDYLIDLRGTREDSALRGWLSEERPMRSIGSIAPRFLNAFSYAPTALAEHYDGLAFFARTTRARPVRSPP